MSADSSKPDGRPIDLEGPVPDMCDVDCEHEDEVARVRGNMPDTADLFELAELYKMLGDSTRVRILSALAVAELCVCDIAAVIGMERTAVSHQLRLLRSARLVRARREGKNIFYSLDDDHVLGLFEQGFAHIAEMRHG